MSKLKRDELRVIVCFAGIAGLFFQLIAQTVFGAVIGSGLTGSFVTLVTVAIGDAAWERYTTKRGTDPELPSSPPKEPSSSPTTQQRPNGQRERAEIESLAVAT